MGETLGKEQGHVMDDNGGERLEKIWHGCPAIAMNCRKAQTLSSSVGPNGD